MTKRVIITLFLSTLLVVLAVTQTHAQSDAVKIHAALSDESVSALKELRLNSGVTSLPSYAHAYYKIGVEKRGAGNPLKAMQAFRAARDLDPYFLDPRFSLFKAYLLRDPGAAFAEISAVVQVLREDFLGQYLLFKNATLMSYYTLLIALMLFAALVSVRHVTKLRHVISERLSAEMSSNMAGWMGLFVLLQPLVWSLGAAGTILCYSGSLWKCMNRREKFFGLFFLALVATTPFFLHEMSSRFPAVDENSPTYVSYEALRNGWSPELEKALVRLSEKDPQNPLYHFAYGTMARRVGKLGIARTELETAVQLSAGDAASLNNLGNVYFNLGDLAVAQNLYTKAIDAAPSLAQPHYNLGQVFTKRLMFAEANKELKTANTQSPSLINEFSINSREQLNRSVIDVGPAASSFWKNLRRDRTRGNPVVISPATLRLLGIGTGRRSSMVLVFFALSTLGGVLAFRNLYTYSCSNCGKTVCRKCLTRVHRKLFCLKCGAAASALRSEEFTRLLLSNQLRLEGRRTRPISLFFGAVIPGFRLVQKGDAVSGFLFLCLSSAAAVYIYGAGYLIDYVPSLRYQQEHLFKYVAVIAPLALIHGLVLFRLSREAAPQPVSLRLVKTQPARSMAKDGTTGKS